MALKDLASPAPRPTGMVPSLVLDSPINRNAFFAYVSPMLVPTCRL